MESVWIGAPRIGTIFGPATIRPSAAAATTLGPLPLGRAPDRALPVSPTQS